MPTPLRWTAEYFRWCGVAGGVGLVFFTALMWISSAARANVAAHAASYATALIASAITSASWWWTGERLRGRHRDGAWMAIASLVIPTFGLGHGGRGPGIRTLVISVLGLAAIFASWKELD